MNAPWEFQFLGRLGARRGDQTVHRFASSRVTALLARLALFPRRDHPREELIDLLWPDSDLAAGRLNLRVALASLRRQLEPPDVPSGSVLLADRLTICLRPAVFCCDVTEFEAAVKDAARAASPEDKRRALDRADALFCGELLPGFYDDWIADERERLNALAEEVRRQRESLPEPSSGPAQAGQTATPGITIPGTFPALLNFPHQWTRFFGREAETAEIVRLLTDPEERLVTLSGPGGSGKTRLALEAARQAAPRFAGPVCFAPLADLSDAAFIPDILLSALGLARSAAESPLDQITAHLAALPPGLLVLDNFEHLVERGAPWLLSLLGRVPHLTCLVTSRRRLALPGEREILTSPLPLPDETGTAGEIAQSASVRLFTDRAQAGRPDFQITPHNAPAVAALCRTLEGIPLAIELAAARVSALTPAQINERLLSRFEILTSRRGDKGGRHRSLWAALDWSFALLPPDLRVFFARLSVFRGGWTAEAAAAVCGEPRALEFLTQLRERSLALVSEEAGEMRFRLLETLREFGAEQLGDAETAALPGRHADWYGDLVREAEGQLTRPEQARWLERLEADHDNLRVALAFRLTAGEGSAEDTDAAFSLCAGLWRFWSVRGHHTSASEWMRRALVRPGGSPALRARTANGAGNLAYVRGDYDAAEALYTEALELMRQEDDGHGSQKHIIGICLCNLGILATQRGDYERAEALQHEALHLQREFGSVRSTAFTLQCLGVVAQHRKDYAAARARHEESYALSVSLGDDGGQLWTVANLADIAHKQGDSARTDTLTAQALTLCVKLQDRHALHNLLAQTAGFCTARGNPHKAVRLQAASEALRRRIGAGLSPADAAERARQQDEAHAHLTPADYAAAWADGEALTEEQAVALALE